ncbi:hypothetical protein [Pseudostreptobacillus hongkongensis]|uniref:hypothetical protein n=1 Tax=Pseudostreptobacillus hongkongensis TaxID=1162717 RepID=UPI00082BDFA8|nr:hypothetical protein [Pseudostreptobacillus hongkongensis]
MDKLIKNIEIPDFINIRILELNNEVCFYFVDKYNEKYFYIKEDNVLCTHQPTYVNYGFLYLQRAIVIHRNDLNMLKKDIYNLYKQLTFKIERAEKYAKYYYINDYFEVKSFTEEKYPTDNKLYNSFNYFLTKEEAEKCAKKLKEYLIKLRKEEYLKGE